MKISTATRLSFIFSGMFLLSIRCGNIDKGNPGKEGAANYIEAKAVINQKMPERVTRYGAKPARYNITVIDSSGRKTPRYNCELPGIHGINDTLTVYYESSGSTIGNVLVKKP